MKNNFFDNDRYSEERVEKRFATFEGKIRAAISSLKLSDEETAIVNAMVGIEGYSQHLLASDMSARRESDAKFAKIMAKHFNASSSSSRCYYFATFFDDVGVTSDRLPVVNLKALHNKVYRALKALEVHAVAVIEDHPLINYPGGGKGRSLLWHAHAILWTDNPIDPNDAVATLTKSGAWTCALGAPPIDIVPIVDDVEHIKRVAHYLLKPPHSAKNRMPSTKRPGEFLLMDTTAGYRNGLALRVLEGLSQIELMDLVFGVGDGKKIRQDLRGHMTRWHRQRPLEDTMLDGTFDVWDWWFRMRRDRGRKLYSPYRIIGGGLRLRAVPPRPRGRRLKLSAQMRKRRQNPMFVGLKARRAALERRQSRRSKKKPD